MPERRADHQQTGAGAALDARSKVKIGTGTALVALRYLPRLAGHASAHGLHDPSGARSGQRWPVPVSKPSATSRIVESSELKAAAVRQSASLAAWLE